MSIAVGSTSSEDGCVLVTFRLPDAGVAERVCVVGEFNEWSRTATPMELEDDGFVARVALAPNRSYRFRYLLDDTRWENDWCADRYVANEFGGDDSVIDVLSSAGASTWDRA